MVSNLANSVSLFRVSADSKFLDLMIDSPRNYYLNYFVLNVWLPSSDSTISFDLSDATFYDANNQWIQQNHWVIRIPLEDLAINDPAMYYATLKAEYDDGTTPAGTYDPLITELVASDVNYAYECMLKNILSLGKCDTLSDDMIRNYLLLYGHQSAMFVNDDETAKEYFRIISSCFNKCGTTTPSGSSCGCKK